MERAARKRSAKPGRMAASGLPIGMPLTSPSGFARARRSRSSIRLKLSPVSSRLVRRSTHFGINNSFPQGKGLREGVMGAYLDRRAGPGVRLRGDQRYNDRSTPESRQLVWTPKSAAPARTGYPPMSTAAWQPGCWGQRASFSWPELGLSPRGRLRRIRSIRNISPAGCAYRSRRC